MDDTASISVPLDTPPPQPTMQQPMMQQPTMQQPMMQQPMMQQPMMQQPMMQQPMMPPPVQPSGNTLRDVEVRKPEFQQFDMGYTAYPKENMNVLLDVSLEISVELGRTQKKIREILEYGPGSVLELDRLVGEPIDVLVNGKFIAKGEVVVIDESFGIRITDIISPENRI